VCFYVYGRKNKATVKTHDIEIAVVFCNYDRVCYKYVSRYQMYVVKYSFHWDIYV
jgi:hypothetical protein